MRDTAYIIDAMHFIFRSYYSLPEFYSPDGILTNAIYGYIRTLLKIIKQKNPTYLITVFDSGPITFRNRMLKSYKQNRGEPPDDLIPQFGYAYKISKQIGIPHFKKQGYEADDLIATLTRFFLQKKKKVVIISNDKDLFQLIGPSVRVWDISKNRIFRKQDVIEKFQIKPKQIPDFIALSGDAIDNIPGVPGIGPKTAATLLNIFPNIETLYRHLDRLRQTQIGRSHRIRNQLLENKESAFLYKKIAQLDSTIPLKLKLIQLQYKKPKKSQFAKLFHRMGFNRLKNEIPFLSP